MSLLVSAHFNFNMEELLDSYVADIGDFYACSQVKIYETPPSSVQFLRDCVNDHQPCIIRGLLDDWPAMKVFIIHSINQSNQLLTSLLLVTSGILIISKKNMVKLMWI